MHKIISSVPFFYTDSSIFIYFSCCIRQQMRYHRNTISQRVKKRPEPLLSQGFRRPCQGVDATGFEPATSASRTQRSTKLSHASISTVRIDCLNILAKETAFVHNFFQITANFFFTAPHICPFHATRETFGGIPWKFYVKNAPVFWRHSASF